jgi:UDPglucose--hexose-1-phosphate uridylyltransferase
MKAQATARTQPELRKDPITGRWVIVAPERAKRPLQVTEPPNVVLPTECPFCGGNEEETPHEVAAWRTPITAANKHGWRVRVVPNKFPALRGQGETDLRSEGIYDCMNGIGVHEVFIEAAEHVTSLTAVPEENVRATLHLYRDRLRALKQDARLVYGMIFKNVGLQAGASLEHTHSQLIVLPIVPINVQEEMTGSLNRYMEQGECIFCAMIAQESTPPRRMVLETPHFAAFCPFASRFPYETWIVPKRHESHYEEIAAVELSEFAAILKATLERIERTLSRPAYNYLLHTAPFDSPFLPHYHWHLEIIPRLTRVAGFEWGTGFYINPVVPELAAAQLRKGSL